MKNRRDQYKRIFSFFAAVILVGLYTLGFVWAWYQSYSDAILLPFYRRGNWVMILIYIFMVMYMFMRTFFSMVVMMYMFAISMAMFFPM